MPPKVKARPLKGRIKDIPIELINEPAREARKWISSEHIESLAESLNAVGLLHEPIVTQIDGRYEIIAGHCRLLAAKTLHWTSLRCKIVVRKEAEADFIKLHENLYRQDVAVVEQAHFLQMIKDRYNLVDEELAVKVNRSRSWVTRILQAIKWPEDIQQANIDGVLPFETCDVLRKIKSEAYRANLIRYAIEDGCTKRLAQTWYKEWLRNERIKENLRVREEEITDHPLIASDDELLADAIAHQKQETVQRLAALKKRCNLCGTERLQETLVDWSLCADCVQVLYDTIQQKVSEELPPSEEKEDLLF